MLSYISGGCKAREDFFDRIAWLLMSQWILDSFLTSFTFPKVVEKAYHKHIALQFTSPEFCLGVVLLLGFAFKEYQVQREIGHAQHKVVSSIFHMFCSLPLLMTVTSSLARWGNETHIRIRSVASDIWRFVLCIIHPLFIGVALPTEEAFEISPIPLVMCACYILHFMYVSGTRRTVPAALTFMIFQPYLKQGIDTQNMDVDILYRLPMFWSRLVFTVGSFFAAFSMLFIYEQRSRWAYMTRDYFEWTSSTTESFILQRYPNQCFFNLVIPCTNSRDAATSLRSSVTEFFHGRLDSVEGIKWRTLRDAISVCGFVNRETYGSIKQRLKVPGNSGLPMSEAWVSFFSPNTRLMEYFVVENGTVIKNPVRYRMPKSHWKMLLLFFAVSIFDAVYMGWLVRGGN